MITVNNFQITNNGQNLVINVETDQFIIIESILLWNNDSFKDYTKAINLNYKLQNIDNTESFIVTASELEINSFDDMWFIEIKTNYQLEGDPENPVETALAITYNLSPYYKCMLNEYLNHQKTKSACIGCGDEISNMVLTISLITDVIEKSIQEGYYSQAISELNKVKKLCSITKCNNCYKLKCSTCSKFIQT